MTETTTFKPTTAEQHIQTLIKNDKLVRVAEDQTVFDQIGTLQKSGKLRVLFVNFLTKDYFLFEGRSKHSYQDRLKVIKNKYPGMHLDIFVFKAGHGGYQDQQKIKLITGLQLMEFSEARQKKAYAKNESTHHKLYSVKRKDSCFIRIFSAPAATDPYKVFKQRNRYHTFYSATLSKTQTVTATDVYVQEALKLGQSTKEDLVFEDYPIPSHIQTLSQLGHFVRQSNLSIFKQYNCPQEPEVDSQESEEDGFDYLQNLIDAGKLVKVTSYTEVPTPHKEDNDGYYLIFLYPKLNRHYHVYSKNPRLLIRRMMADCKKQGTSEEISSFTQAIKCSQFYEWTIYRTTQTGKDFIRIEQLIDSLPYEKFDAVHKPRRSINDFSLYCVECKKTRLKRWVASKSNAKPNSILVRAKRSISRTQSAVTNMFQKNIKLKTIMNEFVANDNDKDFIVTEYPEHESVKDLPINLIPYTIRTLNIQELQALSC